jgi:hypothetical protein
MQGWSARHGREKFVNIGGAFVSEKHWFLQRAAGLVPADEKKAWSVSRAREALRAELALLRSSPVCGDVTIDALVTAVDPSNTLCCGPIQFVSFWTGKTPLTKNVKDVFDDAKALIKEFGQLQEGALQCAREARARAETWEQEERRALRMAGGEAASNIARMNAEDARAKENEANEAADLYHRAIHGNG